MPETTTAKPEALSASVSPQPARPLPGTRHAVMAACAASLRAAAADLEDPRLMPVELRRSTAAQLAVASWLRRRADLVDAPPPLTAWERNQDQLLAIDQPELDGQVHRAVVEALGGLQGVLAGYGLSVYDVPELRRGLAAAFSAKVPA